MSDFFTQAIFERMRDDSTLVAMLGSGINSIVTGEEIPPDTSLWPLVYAYGFGNFNDGGVKNNGGVFFTKNILAMSRVISSMAEVGSIAHQVRALFNRQPFALTGYNTLVVEAGGPRDIPSDENISVL